MISFDDAKVHVLLYQSVTHSGRSVVLSGKFQVPWLKFQIPTYDNGEVEILISSFSSLGLGILKLI